jgi:hypothetical protein
MAKVLCVLYPGPESGCLHKYAREDTRSLRPTSLGGAIRGDYLFVHGGQLAGTGAVSYSVAGTASPGSSAQDTQLADAHGRQGRAREFREKQ